MTPPATTAPVANQDSPFLRLPGEIRNRILEFAMATGGKVFISPSPDPSRSPARPAIGDPGVPYYRYWQTAPQVLQVCKELREEGLGLYYGKNTFRFSDRMFRAFEGFTVARAPGLQHLQSVDITHEVTVSTALPQCATWRNYDVIHGLRNWRVVFVATAAETGFEVEVRKTKKIDDGEGDGYSHGEREGLCCCTLAEMGKTALKRPGALIGMLWAYVRLVEAYGDSARRIGEDWQRAGWAGVIGAKACLRCKKVMGI